MPQNTLSQNSLPHLLTGFMFWLISATAALVPHTHMHLSCRQTMAPAAAAAAAWSPTMV
jgi:hypothetical protein